MEWGHYVGMEMRSKEELKKIRQQAQESLKRDFVPGKKPVKKDPTKGYGRGGFGK